jgi:arabinose-5-phosphate isomerase
MSSLEFGRACLRTEADAIQRLADRLDEGFVRALELLDGCPGKVVLTGVGKSGMAARKIAATLTSTGCPAVFLHPSEAIHGDLGIVSAGDVVIALSNSGESEELLAILPALLSRGAPIVAITGNMDSTLASRAAIALDAGVEREACPLNLAPTTSVVAAMAVGDALAMALQWKRGFREEDYAQNHPGGRLGRRLTLRVRDVMSPAAGSRIAPESSLLDVLQAVTAGAAGAGCVTDSQGALLGIITDFDIRRAFEQHGAALFDRTARDVMNAHPAVILAPDQLAYEALRLMEDRPRPVSVAPIVDVDGRYAGLLRVHDLVRAGL